jgi:hypothetical protein
MPAAIVWVPIDDAAVRPMPVSDRSWAATVIFEVPSALASAWMVVPEA